MPTNTPVNPPTRTPAPTNQSDSPGNSAGVIPVTSSELITLDCQTTVNVFGVKVIFFNLCDYQADVSSMNATNLPGPLPTGSPFVMGLDVLVLNQGQDIKSLPDGTGIEMDSPVPSGSQDQFSVPYWSDGDDDGSGEWIEISQQINSDQLSQILSADPADQLYHITTTADDHVYKILTEEKTGIFVLVKK